MHLVSKSPSLVQGLVHVREDGHVSPKMLDLGTSQPNLLVDVLLPLRVVATRKPRVKPQTLLIEGLEDPGLEVEQLRVRIEVVVLLVAEGAALESRDVGEHRDNLQLVLLLDSDVLIQSGLKLLDGHLQEFLTGRRLLTNVSLKIGQLFDPVDLLTSIGIVAVVRG